ncbi:hypothetical protein [Candidatus Stoquefichus massiliensis]|uniref:hypothetical protein n=1 Tax=Candidatus Stoquefichus massiliensis TaxID=1470350 RepID=UPI000481F436|nr:hypothetical protein [Candidatus Stoquefichus massiliensis]
MFKKYRLTKDEKELLFSLLEMKDLNPDDGYVKKDVIEFTNSNRALGKEEIRQIRNYVIQKNIEYGFENDEPNELGYETEELFDKLFDILEEKDYY